MGERREGGREGHSLDCVVVVSGSEQQDRDREGERGEGAEAGEGSVVSRPLIARESQQPWIDMELRPKSERPCRSRSPSFLTLTVCRHSLQGVFIYDVHRFL